MKKFSEQELLLKWDMEPINYCPGPGDDDPPPDPPDPPDPPPGGSRY